MVPGLAVTTLSWLVFVVVWGALALWRARVAGRQGHSFFGFFTLSLFFVPLAVVVTYVSGSRNARPGTT